MRNTWRLLLLRNYSRSPVHISSYISHFQVQSSPNPHTFRSFSSIIHKHSHQLHSFHPTFDSEFTNSRYLGTRSFSSEVALEDKDLDHLAIIDIFSKPRAVDEIRKKLESNNIIISHDYVLNVLQNLESNLDVARRFFDWVSVADSARLSSKSYNLMLGILGVNGLVKEFWDLVDIMKNKGYGVSKRVYFTVLEKFLEERLASDLEKLQGVYASGSVDKSTEKVCSKVCKIIRSETWGDEVEGRLRDSNVTFASDLVKMVLENLGPEPTKALIFFRWVEEGGLFKHDEQTYNAILRVLGREDCIDRFWKVVDELRSHGYEMEMPTYVMVLGRFCKRKMIKEAVDLYEFAMAGANKPSGGNCTFLLKKVVVSKELDIGLFSRVVKSFRDGGNELTNTMLDAVLKSLNSVGRIGECNRILKAMEEGGFVADSTSQSKIAFRLSRAGKREEIGEFMDHMETSGCNPNFKTWASLIEGHCRAGNLDKASDCFRKMVEKEGTSCAGNVFESLVNAFCSERRAKYACKLLSDMVIEKQLKPWHTTYKTLITSLLFQRGFKEALNLLSLMKNHGFPPYLDPFIRHISVSGTGDDAVMFVKAMTVKRFPSTDVFLRLFKAFFKAKRHNEAQDFLSKCPGFIRNHADVLNLFYEMKAREAAATTTVAA